MPFQSSRQQSWMWANHPEIARRWTAETGSFKGSQNFKPSPRSESHETWRRGQDSLPRKPGALRDFKALSPSASARFKPRNAARPNQLESDREEPVTFVHGKDHGHQELGKAREHPKGLRGRDTRVSSRSRV